MRRPRPRPPQSVGAVELFVSPDGRDSWPGTESRPFATLERAQRAVRARTAGMRSDIIVSLRGGTYRLRKPLRFSAAAGDSGQNGHRVIYQAYGDGTPAHERVVISGGRRVTGWRRAGNVDGAWRANVGDLETRQLFVDGKRARRTALGRGLPGKAISVPRGYATRNTVPQSWQHPEDMELVFNGGKGGLPYSEARCGVSRIRGDAEWSLIDRRRAVLQQSQEGLRRGCSGADARRTHGRREQPQPAPQAEVAGTSIVPGRAAMFCTTCPAGGRIRGRCRSSPRSWSGCSWAKGRPPPRFTTWHSGG